MNREPILMPCEGAGAPGNRLGRAAHCMMCHAAFTLDLAESIPSHSRPDVLAMLERGDYEDD